MTHPLATLLKDVPRYRLNGYDAGTEPAKEGGIVFMSEVLAALEAAPVPDLGEAAAMVLDAMNDGEVWGRAVNAAMPIINADLDQSAWVTVSEVREALVAALRALIGEARDD